MVRYAVFEVYNLFDQINTEVLRCKVEVLTPTTTKIFEEAVLCLTSPIILPSADSTSATAVVFLSSISFSSNRPPLQIRNNRRDTTSMKRTTSAPPKNLSTRSAPPETKAKIVPQ
ncbi:unnamed protein product [Vicia faba]|uniref:Uncharacterized protein n=1 Tax=Vicia faba TaxID=3906 RepID=A0AAV1B025_VICFA|nr:unnamed protein product [Vicia faba]